MKILTTVTNLLLNIKTVQRSPKYFMNCIKAIRVWNAVRSHFFLGGGWGLGEGLFFYWVFLGGGGDFFNFKSKLRSIMQKTVKNSYRIANRAQKTYCLLKRYINDLILKITKKKLKYKASNIQFL